MKLKKLKYGDPSNNKEIYESMMVLLDKKKLDCWNCETPEDFEKHEPCEESEKW